MTGHNTTTPAACQQFFGENEPCFAAGPPLLAANERNERKKGTADCADCSDFYSTFNAL
jgi:hypothetical protein